MSKTNGPYHRTGEPGGPACPLGVLPIQFKDQNGELRSGTLVAAPEAATELEMLRNIASRLGIIWGHDQLGWWAAVPDIQFPCWSVWRQDDNGNKFLMNFNMSEAQAKQMVSHYESLGHKQCYWAQNEMPT
jgi:hypothetical protein